MRHFKILIFFSITTCIVSCFSIDTKIKSGHLGGSSWYNPSLKTVIYFNKNTSAVISLYNGYPAGKYTSRIARIEKDFTFDRNTKRGTIDNVSFEVKNHIGNNGEEGFYLIYDGTMYLLEKDFSD